MGRHSGRLVRVDAQHRVAAARRWFTICRIQQSHNYVQAAVTTTIRRPFDGQSTAYQRSPGADPGFTKLEVQISSGGARNWGTVAPLLPFPPLPPFPSLPPHPMSCPVPPIPSVTFLPSLFHPFPFSSFPPL